MAARIRGQRESDRCPALHGPPRQAQGFSLPIIAPALGALLALFLAPPGRAAGEIILYVNAASPCASGCGSEAAPYRTIQAAIDDANGRIGSGAADSATIRVATGRYAEKLYIYPDIHVFGAGAGSTVIDATGLGRSAIIFAGGGTPRPRRNFSIDGVTITGGSGETTAVVDSVVGGGIYIYGDAVVTNCAIAGNVLAGRNKDWLGAGIFVATGNPVIAGNDIFGNVSTPPKSGGAGDTHGAGGGVMSLYPGTTPQIIGNVIHDNLVQAEIGRGGGVWVKGGTAQVTRNVIYGNRASSSGGGLSLYSNTTYPGPLRIDGNLVFGNSASLTGAGVDLLNATATITLNTIVGNSLTQATIPSGYVFSTRGAAIYSESTLPPPNNPPVRLSNNLIYGNSATATGAGAGLYSYFSPPIIDHNLFYGDFLRPGTAAEIGGDYSPAQVIGVSGNISVDPALARQPLFYDVTAATGTTGSLLLLDVARYRIGDVLEYALDGVPRTVTTINATSRTVAFSPALAAASQAFQPVADWGAAGVPGADFHLRAGSPAVDAGTNVDVAPTDLDGLPRPADGNGDGSAVIDLGAYEIPTLDRDGDCVPDMLDCAPLVGSVSRPPTAVGPSLSLSAAGGFNLFWLQAGQANVYNIYRGDIAPGGFTYNHACLEAGSPDTLGQDPSAPAPGRVYYYLVSAASRCGESSLGIASGGAERPIPAPCQPGARDTDADGLVDLDDGCALTASAVQSDADCDGRATACDNCASIVNPDLHDFNADGVGDACQDSDLDQILDDVDCAPANPHLTGPPGEVPGVAWSRAGGTGASMTWLLAAQAPASSVYRGTIASIGELSWSHGCLRGSILDATLSDADVPPPGAAFYYLVAGANSCGEGILGRLASGAPIPSSGTCAPTRGDADHDGLADLDDDCPLAVNPGQEDADGDARGDVCDNCPLTTNPDQADQDGDGIGDACEV